MSLPLVVERSVRKPFALVLVLGLVLAACSGWGRRQIPFELTESVSSVLTDWREAGLSCNDPEVGMPGPAADWVCRGKLQGVEMNARLIADHLGVQSIHAGVASASPGPNIAAAFVSLVEATSLIDAARPEIEAWLLEGDAADGVMPMTAATQLGRASIAADNEGPVLYIIPLGSSMLLAR